MAEIEFLQVRMEADEDSYEKAKAELESIDSGHNQTNLWQMASEIETLIIEVQKQLENVSSQHDVEVCIARENELQKKIEILVAEIYELQQGASVK